MSGDTSQTQSTSTLFNFFNIFDKLKFKKKSKRKTSGLLESCPEKNEIVIKNENTVQNNSDNNGILKKCDNKRSLKVNKDNSDNILKDILITNIENYADIEKKLIANNSFKEGRIVSEILPNKTLEKDNKLSDFECIVLHQKKHKSKKKEKVDNEETSAKEGQVYESSELNENVEKEPASDTCLDDNNNSNNNNNKINNNHSNDNNNISNLSGDCSGDINTEKSEIKKHKENKHLRCEYIVENCNIMELNKDAINELKTQPVNFSDKQLLLMEGKHIKKALDHNKVDNKRSNTLKLKKCKASYFEKPSNHKCTNSQSNFVKAIRNENATFNISKSVIITNNSVGNQKTHAQDLPTFSVDNINPIRESVTSKKKKRRKTLNAYHELTKPRSNLVIMEKNIGDKNMLNSNEIGLVSETDEERHMKATAYLDNVPVRDSKDSSIDQWNVESKKNSFIILPSDDINNKLLDKCIHNNHPNIKTVLPKKFYNQCDEHSNKVTHEQRTYPTNERFTNAAEQKTIDIEVNFDDKPNEHYNFLIENKNCGFSTKCVTNNNDFPYYSIRNKLSALKTASFKNKTNNVQFQEENRHSSTLPHTLKVNRIRNEYNHNTLKKIKSKSFNKSNLRSIYAEHVCKQKRLPYTLVKKSFIPDMEHKEYISVANIRASLKLKSETLNEISVHHKSKFKINSDQSVYEAKRNSSPKENKLEENGNKKFNISQCHTNFPGDCFVDKNMQTNEEGRYLFNTNVENVKNKEKGDYVSDESEILVNQFNMFLKIMKKFKAGNVDSMESVIKDTDLLSKCLRMVNSEKYSASNRDKFVRVIESTEVEKWKSEIPEFIESKSKQLAMLQKSSKCVKSEDHSKEPNRDYFVRVVESTEIKNMKTEHTEFESSPTHDDSTSKMYKLLKHKCNKVPNRNNFVRIVRSSEFNSNNTEDGIKYNSNNLLVNSYLKNKINTGVSVSSRETMLANFFQNQNKTSCIQSHPRLSVNFVNVSKNKRIYSDAATDGLCHNEEDKPWALKDEGTRSLSDNGILNRKVSNEIGSHYNQHFSDLEYRHNENFKHSDFTAIKRSMNSCENNISFGSNNNNNNNSKCYQPEGCGEVIEDVLTNRQYGEIYTVKSGNTCKNLLKENEHKNNIISQTKCSRLCNNLGDISIQQNGKCIQNFSSVNIKKIFKSLSDSNLSNGSLSTENIILKDSGYSGLTLQKTKYKKQQKIISKDMGMNTDMYATESEYLFNKCILLLTKHLIKIYELCDKKRYSSNESGNEFSSDNINLIKKESISRCNVCRDSDSGNVKLPCSQHYKEEHYKTNEELYNLLCLMLTNNLNIAEMSGRNKAFLNNMRDVVCQYIEKPFKELNKSIAELSKIVSEAVIKKHSNESVCTLNNDIKSIKHNELKSQPDQNGVQVEHKTSEILELMKVIENSDISSSGCTESSYIESKDCKRNCKSNTNRNSMECKSGMCFHVDLQLNDRLEVEKLIVEGSG